MNFDQVLELLFNVTGSGIIVSALLGLILAIFVNHDELEEEDE